jgi:prevent-host-death family protein
MKIASIADVKAQLSSFVRESEAGPVIITKHGRPVAVLLPVTDEAELERLILAYTPRFRELINQAEQRIKETGGVKHDDFWQMVEAQSAADEAEEEVERQG